MELDPGRRRELAQQGRLWALALVCAAVGAITVGRTDSVYVGTGAFLLTLLVLGPVLFAYERRQKRLRLRSGGAGRPAPRAEVPPAGPGRRSRRR